jgi:tetratricopeptide (TPR) repeat protein
MGIRQGIAAIRLPLAVLLAVAAAPAAASVTTLGGGLGRDCYLAAELKREPRSSIALCTRALEGDTMPRRDRAATLVNRGIIHMHVRDFAAALQDYEAAIRMDPRLAEAHVNLGILLLHKGGQDRAAIDALTRGLAIGPTRPEVAHYTRAVAHELVGNVREAFEDYQAAAALRPGWSDPLEQLKRFSVERREGQRG